MVCCGLYSTGNRLVFGFVLDMVMNTFPCKCDKCQEWNRYEIPPVERRDDPFLVTLTCPGCDYKFLYRLRLNDLTPVRKFVSGSPRMG